jgi:hypothetical protein
MGKELSMGVVRTYEVTFTTNVGAAYIEQAIVVPYKGIIRRARADVTAGTGTPTVGLSFRRIAGGAGPFDILLEYGLTADPLDSQEEVDYERDPATPLESNEYYAEMFVAVLTSDATVDHTVEVQLTIESPGEPGGYGQGSIR